MPWDGCKRNVAKIKYRDWNPSTGTQRRVLQLASILAEYPKQRVTVRQLYYRLVAKALIANNDKEYRKVQSVITDARYAGLIDWDAVEDRNREPMRPREWSSGRQALDAVISGFRMNRWANQPFYVELWVEKAALAGILEPICNDYHITLMVNRGYSSASAMKESAERIRAAVRSGVNRPHPIVLYIGDHDPSGLDMPRDIKARLLEFECPDYIDVRPVALTMAQIEEHNPPPNPVKLKDVRSEAYVSQFGHESWEADALPPPVLDLTVRQTINAYLDKDAMTKAIANEYKVKAKIKAFAASFKE